jgi:hypothetical protein
MVGWSFWDAAQQPAEPGTAGLAAGGSCRLDWAAAGRFTEHFGGIGPGEYETSANVECAD